METPRIVSGYGDEHRSSGVPGASNARMAERARMFRRWADSFPAPVAHACRRRACELTLMAQLAGAAR